MKVILLRQSHRQQNQTEFFDILQNIQLENITNEIWKKLQRKHQQYNSNKPIDLLLNITNIIGYCETVDKVNCLICNTLSTIQEKFMISHAIDIINGEQWSISKIEKSFKSKKNLPASVKLQ